MRIAGGALAIDEALGAAAAALVQHDDRLVDQLVLRDDRLHRAREVVGAAARTRGDDEFHRLRRLPFRGCSTAEQRERHRARADGCDFTDPALL